MAYVYGYGNSRPLSDLVNQTFDQIVVDPENTTLDFVRDGKAVFAMGHIQDCCESVWIDDINGDLSDFQGQPITIAEERTHNQGFDPDDYESVTWTFYLLGCPRGTVLIRWCGSSNGYYSESVELYKVE